MAHRIVEGLIGRLVTDERFRSEFCAHPEATLVRLRDDGYDLSSTEIAALAQTDPRIWARAAEGLDPRLMKLVTQGRTSG